MIAAWNASAEAPRARGIGRGSRAEDHEWPDARRASERRVVLEELEPPFILVERDHGRDAKAPGQAIEFLGVQRLERPTEQRDAVPLLDEAGMGRLAAEPV